MIQFSINGICTFFFLIQQNDSLVPDHDSLSCLIQHGLELSEIIMSLIGVMSMISVKLH